MNAPIRTREARLLVRRIVLGCTIAGGLYGLVAGDNLPAVRTLQGALTGMLISLAVAWFELWFVYTRHGEELRRSRFPVHISVKSLFYFVSIVSPLALGEVVFDRHSASAIVRDPTFFGSLAFAVAVAFVVNFLLLVQRMLGAHVLRDFFTGKYHRPREVERIFMFLDIESSTAIAERLGPRRYLSFLNRFFFDIAEPVLASAGSIHQYVGDEAVIVWRLEEGLEDANCLRCYFRIADRFERLQSRYLHEFGVAPDFRAALHGGPVVVGEIGDLKREIVFVGDTMNTAARMEEICKREGHRLLVSGDLLSRLDVPNDLEFWAVASVTLRGHERPTELFSVARRLEKNLPAEIRQAR